MKLPEKPPAATTSLSQLVQTVKNIALLKDEINNVQKDYLYWDKIKHIKTQNNVSSNEFWYALKQFRRSNSISILFGNYNFQLNITSHIQKVLHEFDMNYGGVLKSDGRLQETDKQQYLISSIMEESIASSVIEGAVTTRKKAKEMLKQNRSPRNKSERMIYNNYITIQHIKEHSKELLTREKLLEVHRLITYQTLENAEDEGKLRQDDDVNVVDFTDGEIIFQPPPYKQMNKLVDDLCRFFNEDNEEIFIHPVVKASVIHFMIGFIHPFADGNGRTARALFYWYMLRKGYWLTEYLSISSAILKSRIQYYRSFLYVELDDNDITYFIQYKMKTLRQAYENLQSYLERKMKEKQAASKYLKIGGINERQALILQWIMEEPERIYTVKELEKWFGIANQTARNDLQGLVDLKLLSQQHVNKKKQIFARIELFDKRIKELHKYIY